VRNRPDSTFARNDRYIPLCCAPERFNHIIARSYTQNIFWWIVCNGTMNRRMLTVWCADKLVLQSKYRHATFKTHIFIPRRESKYHHAALKTLFPPRRKYSRCCGNRWACMRVACVCVRACVCVCVCCVFSRRSALYTNEDEYQEHRITLGMFSSVSQHLPLSAPGSVNGSRFKTVTSWWENT